MSLNEEHDIKKIYVDITTIDICKSSVSLSINFQICHNEHVFNSLIEEFLLNLTLHLLKTRLMAYEVYITDINQE